MIEPYKDKHVAVEMYSKKDEIFFLATSGTPDDMPCGYCPRNLKDAVFNLRVMGSRVKSIWHYTGHGKWEQIDKLPKEM